MIHKLKVGIAGYGVVGKRRQKFIDKHDLFRVVAVCDRNFNGPLQKVDDLNCYSNYQDMLASEKLDVLFVCLPNDLAPEATIAGLNCNLHVFCEKPPGRNVQDIQKVITSEKKSPHLKLKYGFNHRYHDSVLEALQLIQSGKFGKIINMRGVYGKASISPWNEPSKDHWRTQRALAGGGILLDQGIHMVDLMRLFAGEFTEVKSFVSNDFWNLDVEDNAYALMKNKNGVIAMFHSTATQWKHSFLLEVFLEKGAIILSGILSGTKSYGQEVLKIVHRNPSDGGNTKEQSNSYIEDNSWWNEICEFADCIQNDRPIQVGTAKDALKTMELVYKIYCADSEWVNKYNITMD